MKKKLANTSKMTTSRQNNNAAIQCKGVHSQPVAMAALEHLSPLAFSAKGKADILIQTKSAFKRSVMLSTHPIGNG